MITAIEDYFALGCGRCERFATADCSTRSWLRGLRELRRMCLAAGLRETVKWGHPCYMHAGRNLAILGAFRDDFRLSFFDGALLQDPSGLLEKQGPRARHADAIRFRDNERVAELESVIMSYLREAMSYAEAGLQSPREREPLELPDELRMAFEADPELADAFSRLTPGRQRSYVLNLEAAKMSATRASRVAKWRLKILAGKGLNER